MTVDDILEDLTEVITHAGRYRLDKSQLALLQEARQRIDAVCADEMAIEEDDPNPHARVARLHIRAEDAGSNLCGSRSDSLDADPDDQIRLRRRATAIA